MIVLLDKFNLYATFNIKSFDELENSVENISPSMTEYYLSDLASLVSGNTYLNKSNIEKSLFLDKYSLYLDYNDDIYLEVVQDENKDEYETASLW